MNIITPQTGQIRKGSIPGDKIYEISRWGHVKTIVEIGTWKGMGSTKCILDAIIDSKKTNCEVYSIECNKFFHEEAKANLGILPPKFQLIHGSIFDWKELYPIREKLKGIPCQWINEDISGMRNSENVFHKLPEKIDFLILDGGEFSGEIEFKLLWERSKYIFMDDTNSTKNKNNRKFILNNPKLFKIIYDNINERCLICKNLK